MKLMYLAYFIAAFVANVPINNQHTTAHKLKQARTIGFTPAATP